MSEQKDWLFRIRDILHSINRIEMAVIGLSFEIYDSNEDLQDIVERRFQIISDAARKIPDEVKAGYPALPWSKMIGLRNFVVHEYNNVDRRIVWDTVQKILPALKNDLESILLSEERKSNG